MSISAYDPNRFDRELPANVRGGISRAKMPRDILGRFLPATGELPYDIHHGEAGGLKRAATAKREKGRFSK